MSADIVVGQAISHFKILQFLGEGGMGVVYKALDLALNRTVALKFIQPSTLPMPEEKTRFLREAQAAAALNHPNITTVYEVGEAGGRTYIAMEYLAGTTLKDRFRSGPVSLGEAMEIAVQLADGLEEAHRKGVIHRDIKSSNIMVAEKSRVKLMDFGLARLSEVSQTLTVGVQGTVAYMSPEQAAGEPVDHRTDIWSLGVVFYEMLTGSLPFSGDRAQAVIHGILNKQPAPLAAIRSDVPPEVERILTKCLEKNPNGRYPSASALKTDLVAFGRTVSPELAALTLTQTLIHRPMKTRAWRATVAAAIIIAILALAFIIPSSRRTIQTWLGIGIPQQVRLAVLPFVVTGGKEEDRASYDGLVDILIRNLTKMQRFEKSLSVIPSAEVRLVENPSAARLHKSLRVNRMLSGSVNLTAQKPTLMISFIDAEDVRTLNSETIPVTPVSVDELPNTVTDLAIRWLGFHPGPEARRLLAAQTSCLPATNSLYRQARGYLARYETKESLVIAIDQFKKVNEVDPSCAQSFAGLGEACLRLYLISRQPEFLSEALNAARRANELNREAPEVHITLGIILREMGKSDDSRQELAEAINLDPKSADAYRELGYAFIQLKEPEKAEVAFRTAIDLNKDSWSGYSHLGYFYLVQKKDYAKAVENFQKVIELTPDNTRGYSMLGTAYFYLYNLHKAIEMSEKAMNIKATSQVYNNLGFFYFLEKRYTDAVRSFEQAVEMGKKNSKSWGNLADAYRYVPELKDKVKPAYEEAIRLAREGLTRNPKDFELLRRLARYHAYLGLRAEALAEIRQARDLAPEDAQVLESSVEALEIVGERKEALRALEELVRAEGSLQLIVLSPDLEKFRSDPGYAAIMKKVKGIPALK